MRRRIVAAAAALVALGGCYTISYQTKAAGSGEYKQDRGDFFFWGLLGDKTVDLTAACPQGVSRWKSEQTFVDTLLAVVTLGIYIPRHVTVECAGGKAYLIETDEAGVRLVAIHPAQRAKEETP
jgi:hypothetical protein